MSCHIRRLIVLSLSLYNSALGGGAPRSVGVPQNACSVCEWNDVKEGLPALELLATLIKQGYSYMRRRAAGPPAVVTPAVASGGGCWNVAAKAGQSKSALSRSLAAMPSLIRAR